MDGEIDTNKLVLDFVQANLDRIAAAFGSAFRVAKNRLRIHLDRTYSTYLTRILDRYSNSKSFFIRSEPLPLYDFYVPLDLSTQKRTLSMPTPPDIAKVAQSAIITGSGGSGKSLFMRHLLIQTVKSCQKAPVFVELRHLNNNQDTILASLLRALQLYGLDVEDDYVRLALNAGHFCVLLDGFDELELDRRDDVAFQIQDLSERHPGNWIILSSREDSTLDGWSNFAKFDLDPLSLERSVQLIQKLPFDDPVKGKFISDLRGGLYDSHRSFLSNPLLLSIMLLTYSDNAQIPLKLSLFYDQAYESLFQRHDALKGGFQRERRTSLDIQDFSKVFAAFCLQSYDKREFSFSRTKALQYLDRARVISQLSYKSEEFLADAVQGVCLLIEDGLDITFAHRSFQEYFVARFIQASKLPAKQRLVERYLPSFYHELVMELLYEMDPEAVEEYFLIPSIEKLKDVIGVREKIGATHVTRFLKALYSDFMIDFYHEDKQERLGATIENSQLYSMIKFMRPRLRPKVGVGKHRKVVWRDLIDSLRKTYNRDYVPARALRTGDLFVRELIEQGAFDIGLLPELFRFGEAAKIRQAEAAASLESVLA